MTQPSGKLYLSLRDAIVARRAPLAATFVCAGMALFQWSQASRVKTPFALRDLRVVETVVESVTHGQATTFDNDQLRFRSRLRYAMTLPEYPGVAFPVAPAPGVTELKGATARLELLGDPVAARALHAETPAFTREILVVGVSVGGRVLLSAEATLERARAAKARANRIGWAFALAALVGLAWLGWRDRAALLALRDKRSR